jgi:hypothetical protein
MKKLLALVLCVVMVMSLAPAAFAGGYAVDDPLYSVAGYKKQIENMIKHTRENVEDAYKALVGDKVVYTSAKAMDDTVVDLVDAIANPLIEKGKVTKAWADGVKNAIRHYLDETVADKIADDYYKCLDKDGNVDDLKYAQLIANSINKALTDKKFVAGYQAVATYFALGQVVSDIKDNLKDEYEAFQDGIDPKFQARFAAQYTNLVDDYIDTLGTATLKVINADLAEVLYAEAVADAEDDYDAAVAAAALARDAAIDKAEEDLAKVVDPAEAKLDKALDDAEAAFDAVEKPAKIARTLGEEWSQAQYEKDMAAAEKTRDDAIDWTEKQYKLDMEAAGEDKQLQAQAKYDHDMRILGIENTFTTDKAKADSDLETRMQLQKDTYDAVVNPAQTAYDADVEAAVAQYAKDTEGAEAKAAAAIKEANEAYDAVEKLATAAYDTAVEEAIAEYGPDMIYEINPWAEVVYPTVGSPW